MDQIAAIIGEFRYSRIGTDENNMKIKMWTL